MVFEAAIGLLRRVVAPVMCMRLAGSIPVFHPRIYLDVAQPGQSAWFGTKGPQVQILPFRQQGGSIEMTSMALEVRVATKPMPRGVQDPPLPEFHSGTFDLDKRFESDAW